MLKIKKPTSSRPVSCLTGIILLHDFDIHAFRQIRQGTGCASLTHGFAENVEDSASGLAVSRLLKVANDGGVSVYRYLDFKSDLLASVNEGLPHSECISALDLVRHVPDICCHGRKIDVGENDARSFRIPDGDFSVGVEPVPGAFAGRFAVEASVGFYAVEFYFVFNFGALDAENACDFAAVQVECYGRITVANRESRVERDLLDRVLDRAAGCGFRRTGRGLRAVLADAEGERFAGSPDVGDFQSRLGAVIPADSGVGVIREFRVGSALEERVGGAARTWPLIARVVA